MIPKEFFVTSGKAVSSVSELNAFDLALEDAGIAQCNLVHVSSILPPDCREVDFKPIPVGSITYTVMARMEGEGGENIAAGISWSFEKGNSYGIVAEAHGHMNREEITRVLEMRIQTMAETRNIELGNIDYRIQTLDVQQANYGCVVAALVYM